MALRTFLFAMVLFAGVCAPVAQAQLQQILISGIVPCINGAQTITETAPVFPNALVQLLCGGTVASSATTNDNGEFTMKVDLETMLLSTILRSCKLVTKTPLSTCGALAPSGILQSFLQFPPGGLVGGILGGILGGVVGDVVNFIPEGFKLVP